MASGDGSRTGGSSDGVCPWPKSLVQFFAFLQPFCPSLKQGGCPPSSMIESMHARIVKGWSQLSTLELDVCSEGTEHTSIFFSFFSPKPTLFLCNRTTIEIKDYFKRGAWYNMRGKKIICVLPQCQSHCSFFWELLSCLSLQAPGWPGGTELTAVVQERSLTVGFWAFIFCCKYCSHTLPPGKSRADGLPIPPTCHTERKRYLLFYMCSSGPEFAELIDCLLKSIRVKLLKGAQRTAR